MAKQPEDMFHFDRRSGKDRRSKDVPSAKSLFIYRRRKKVRRKDDKYKMSYLDQYGSGIFIAIVLLLFFSIIDAFLTLFLIDHGASDITITDKSGCPWTAVETARLRNCLTEIEVIEFGGINFPKLEKLFRGFGRKLQSMKIRETTLPFGIGAGPVTAVWNI